MLSIRGLGRRYGAVAALADLTLDIAAASRTAVVGPSGSGKTTLLRLIAGFEVPDTGEISLDGVKIADPEAGVPPHKRNIGLVMQEGALFPHLSVLDNIRFGIREAADSEAQALKLLELVELPATAAARAPHQLSGGQQQRVALARALARRPRLMLLDEPFSALDATLRDQLRRTTVDILGAAGIATLLVTHDRDEAMQFGDQLVVLHEGRLAQAGHPRDLYVAPANELVAALLGPAIMLDAEIRDGVASSVFGSIALQPGASSANNGQRRIMLRPEQLRLAKGGAASWQLRSVNRVGSRTSITAQHNTGLELAFETPQQDLPEPGTPITITATGAAAVVG